MYPSSPKSPMEKPIASASEAQRDKSSTYAMTNVKTMTGAHAATTYGAARRVQPNSCSAGLPVQPSSPPPRLTNVTAATSGISAMSRTTHGTAASAVSRLRRRSNNVLLMSTTISHPIGGDKT
jgi:hypothetical protein